MRSVVELLFPRRCVACGSGPWPFCPSCRDGLVRLVPPGCERCGRPLDAPVRACRDCPPPGPSWARAPFLYRGPAKRALLHLKFGGHRTVAEALALQMAPLLDPAPVGQVVTWVPLGGRRRRARGFDQAEALARAVAGAAGRPVRGLLERTVETPPQARRGGEARRLALSGAFRPRASVPERVLLVDDVLTSGATGAECAQALLGAGAAEVGLLTAARSLGGPLPARCYKIEVGLQPGSVVARETFSR